MLPRRPIRVVSATVAGVTLAAALTACGQLESRRHAFPDTVYDPAPTPIASGSAAGVGQAGPTSSPKGSGAAVDPSEPYADLTAKQLLERGEAAAEALDTVHTTVSLTQRGMTMRVDAVVDLAEKAYDGTLVVNGRSIHVRLRGSDAWLRADRNYWEDSGASADLARRLADKYVHFPDTHASYAKLAGFLRVLDPAYVTSDYTPLRRLSARDHEGEPVIAVEIRSEGDELTVLLAAERDLVPVRVGDDAGNTVEYRDHDAPVTVARPPAAQVVSSDEVTGDVQLPGV